MVTEKNTKSENLKAYDVLLKKVQEEKATNAEAGVRDITVKTIESAAKIKAIERPESFSSKE
jgi:hypothetical protein